MPPGTVPSIASVTQALQQLLKDAGINFKLSEVQASVAHAFEAGEGGVLNTDINSIAQSAFRYLNKTYSGTDEAGNPFGEAPDGGSTSGGSSGSGGSSSGSGGSSGTPVQAYLTQLQGLGIALTASVRAFAGQAAASGWSGAEFLFFMRQQAWYKNEFPGIFNKDGSMKMSESQYIAQKNAYEDIANTLGFNLTDKMAGLAFKNDLSVNEFRTRYQAERLIKDNPVYFRQLRATLKARGLDLPTHKDLAQFLMNEKPAEFYKVWREASARGSAIMAGMTLSKHPAIGNNETAIGRAGILRIAKMGLSPTQLSQGFAQLADLLVQDLPEAQAMGQGVDKRDFQKAVFGGKGSARAREKVQGLLRNIDAYYNEQRAASQLSSTGQGGTQQIGTEGLAGGTGNVQ